MRTTAAAPHREYSFLISNLKKNTFWLNDNIRGAGSYR
jgi:hypothetical protein